MKDFSGLVPVIPPFNHNYNFLIPFKVRKRCNFISKHHLRGGEVLIGSPCRHGVLLTGMYLMYITNCRWNMHTWSSQLNYACFALLIATAVKIRVMPPTRLRFISKQYIWRLLRFSLLGQTHKLKNDRDRWNLATVCLESLLPPKAAKHVVRASWI